MGKITFGKIKEVIELLKLKTMTSKQISDKTGVGISTVCYIRNGKSYVDMANDMGFIPETKHNFDYEPYVQDVEKLISQGLTSKEIRTQLPLNITDGQYNHFIRKLKKKSN